MITAYISDLKVYSSSADAFALYEKSRFGEKKEGKIEYSLIEALFLLQKKKLEILKSGKMLSYEYLLKKAKKHDKRIEVKLPVFSDLRKKGYIVKTALKFGAEFRVYKKGSLPGQDHALWLLHPVREHEQVAWYDFAAKNRIATSTNKKLLLGIVDEEDDVTYYEIFWLRP